MNNIVERFFESRGQLTQAIVENTESILSNAIKKTGAACFLVSGGSTPQPFYQQLSTSKIDWEKVQIAMVDERWVDPNHSASNELFIRQNLLINEAKKSQFITMKTQSISPLCAQTEINANYANLKSPYDVTVLGLGNDGHTASLFPNSKGLFEALNNDSLICTAIEAKPSQVTGEFLQRMSITINAIKQSKLINLMITGEQKLKTYHKAIAGKDIFEMPIRAVFQQDKCPINVYWAP